MAYLWLCIITSVVCTVIIVVSTAVGINLAPDGEQVDGYSDIAHIQNPLNSKLDPLMKHEVLYSLVVASLQFSSSLSLNQLGCGFCS